MLDINGPKEGMLWRWVRIVKCEAVFLQMINNQALFITVTVWWKTATRKKVTDLNFETILICLHFAGKAFTLMTIWIFSFPSLFRHFPFFAFERKVMPKNMKTNEFTSLAFLFFLQNTIIFHFSLDAIIFPFS